MISECNRLDVLLARACTAHAEKTALIGGDERHSYADLARQGATVAEELRGHELAKDEPVLVVVRNRPLDIAAWLGVWSSGAVVVPVHADVPAAVLEELQQRTGARYMVRGSPSYPWPAGVSSVADASAEERPGQATSPGQPRARHQAHVAVIAASAPPARPLMNGAAFVVFTSGSTGRPKGVVLGHTEYTGKLAANQRIIPFATGERTALILQLTFSFGQWVSLLTLATGGTLVMSGGFHPVQSLQLLAHEEIDRVAAVPTQMRAWLADPATASALARLAELGRPRLLIAGGEVLSEALGRALRERLPRTGIADVYGLTETNTSDFILPPADYDRCAGSIGWPGPGVEIQLGDEHGHPVADGAPGELQLRTPFRMRGYFDDPATTEATFVGQWLRSGDVGRRRPDGTVELVGRQKDLIVRGANKISPLEIEAALVAHPAVEAALAAGLPDDILGERIHVMIVVKRGAEVSEAEVRTFASTRLEKFKIPDRIHFTDTLPVGRTGKADRATMRSQLAASGPRHGA